SDGGSIGPSVLHWEFPMRSHRNGVTTTRYRVESTRTDFEQCTVPSRSPLSSLDEPHRDVSNCWCDVDYAPRSHSCIACRRSYKEAPMKRIWATTLAVLVGGLVVALAAQDPQPSRSAGSAKTITVSGCVQRATEAPTGTSGTAGAPAASSSEPKFLLKSAASAGTGATGTSGSASSATAREYRLDGDDSKLTPHVGHKVEISGSLEEAMPSPSGAASSSSAPKLKVDSVKMIASSCSGD